MFKKENESLVQLEDLLPSCIIEEIESSPSEEFKVDPDEEVDEKLLSFIHRNSQVEKLVNQQFKYNSEKNMSKVLKEEDVKIKPFPIYTQLNAIDEEGNDDSLKRQVVSPRNMFTQQEEMIRYMRNEGKGFNLF